MSLRALSYVGAVVLAALSACTCGEPEVVVTPDGGDLLVECSASEECALGETCVDGACVVAVEQYPDASLCLDDEQCPPGLVCLRSMGVCVEPTQYDGGEVDAGEPGECLDGETRPCGQSKLGECRLGVETCMGGAFGACAGAILPTSEGCDGRDNDCDGFVDEDYDKANDPLNCGSCGRVCSFPFAAAACTGGECQLGACDPGHRDLDGDPDNGCEYVCTVSNGGTELCDGKDNDCDGDVDEGFGTLTCGVGACATSVAACVGGQPQTCVPAAGTAEVCDGVDNDCDGQIDEGLPTLSCGQGQCFRQVAACSAGQPQTCIPGTPSLSEQCDGTDDDCDGQVDEGCACINGTTQACYSGSPGTAGVGACVAGTQTCTSGQWGACAGEITDLPETCNGVDDDCDGQLDEGFGTLSCGTGACQVTVPACANGSLQTCTPGTPTTEVCDGVDNDCDGQIDEGFGNVTCGVGACAVTVSACVNGQPQTCTPASPTAEICDGVDNDCDGAVDETFPQSGQACSTGLAGVCAVGTRQCSGGTLVCAQTVQAAPSDICGNGIDDDCNGTVDDPNQCGCNSAIDNDQDGANECVDCNDHDGSIRPGAVEKCNGKDDDCDGSIDEGFDQDGDGYTTCGTLPGGGVDPTRVDCNDGNAFVFPGKVADCGSASTPASPNGVDDNCNGYVDETCNCSTADQDGDGVSQCAGDCADNDPARFPGKTEICDGKDNDCNAATVDNCGVSEPCGRKQGNSWTPFPAGTDACRSDLICTSNVSTGELTCGSFCNQTLGTGLNDSCAAGQGCFRNLIDSDNLHLCSTLAVGTGATGQTCSIGSACRSGDCLTDGTSKYCSDKCTHEAGCSANTTCFIQKSPLTSGPFVIGNYLYSFCRLDSKITGTKTLGQTCAGSDCRAGPDACFNGKCTQPCCEHADCGVGFACSINGPKASTGYADGQGSPISSIMPACLATTATKVAGQACATSSECRSGICDVASSICVDLCCNDSSCVNGTTCEPVDFKLATGEKSFVRACVFSPVPSLIQQK